MLMTYSPNDLPYLRGVVDPSLAGLPTPQLRSTIDQAFGEGTADSIDDDLEGIFDGFGRALSGAARSVGRFAQREGPGIAQIGGGVLRGAMASSAGGLPGIFAGAAAGGFGAGLSRYGSGNAKRVGDTLTGFTNMVGHLTPMGQAGGALSGVVGSLGQRGAGASASRAGGSGGAVGQLAGLLSSPQAASALSGLFGNGSAAGQLSAAVAHPALQQALAALRLGQFGRPTIAIGAGRQPVPTAVFPQLLGHLGQQAATEAFVGESISDDESLSFMADQTGAFSGDPASPIDRAARLWAMLNEATAEQVLDTIGFEDVEAADAAGDHEEESDAAYYDQLDLADLAEIEGALEWEPRGEW